MNARVEWNGVLWLDKPAGLSSNDALLKAKRLLAAKKAGHTGTLDPFATGLLPVCFGEATKFSADLLEADKTYEALACLGVTTRTGDSEGEILSQSTVNVSRAELDFKLTQFRGDIWQVPPMYSALKRDGKPLYEYARAGLEVTRAARPVRIGALETLSLQGDRWCFRVTCSKGTYIRTLAEDVGRALGCGAHLMALRRTAVGQHTVAEALTLDALHAMSLEERRARCAPVDSLLQSLRALTLAEPQALRFCLGQRLMLTRPDADNEAAPQDWRIRVYAAEHNQRFLGTALWQSSGRLQPERLIAVKN